MCRTIPGDQGGEGQLHLCPGVHQLVEPSRLPAAHEGQDSGQGHTRCGHFFSHSEPRTSTGGT